MKFVLLVLLMLALAYGTKQRVRRRRVYYPVPHSYAEAAPMEPLQPGDDVVTVARLPGNEAAVAQGLLDSAGIAVAMHPAHPTPHRMHESVELRVRADDAETARALLADIREERRGPARG